VPVDARRLAQHESESLAEVIRDINKFSNNVMARQLFLTVGGEVTKQPASIGMRSALSATGWWARGWSGGTSCWKTARDCRASSG